MINPTWWNVLWLQAYPEKVPKPPRAGVSSPSPSLSPSPSTWINLSDAVPALFPNISSMVRDPSGSKVSVSTCNFKRTFQFEIVLLMELIERNVSVYLFRNQTCLRQQFIDTLSVRMIREIQLSFLDRVYKMIKSKIIIILLINIISYMKSSLQVSFTLSSEAFSISLRRPFSTLRSENCSVLQK